MIIEFPPRPILFFDGFCNLCNGTVIFIIRHDKKKRFLFSTLQSPAGKDAIKQVAKSGNSKESVILLFRGKYYTRSAAVLHILRLLGGAWQLFFGLIVIPPFLANRVYDLISRNRYKWFGKKNECMIPTPELAERFIDE